MNYGPETEKTKGMLGNLKVCARNQNFMRYFKNSSWMLSEYVLRVISAIFVSIYVARFLGPEQFGILNYALAIVAIFMALSRLGMESILVRDIAEKPGEAKEYLGTAFSLMAVSAVVGFLILSTLIYLFENDSQTKIYLWIIATGLISQTFLALDYGFQGQVKAKYPAIAKSVALIIGSAFKIYLVWVQAELLLFAIAFALDHALVALMLIIAHAVKKQPKCFFVFHADLVRPLLKSAWPMVLSAIAAMLYMRTDQVMIKNMLDNHQLGLYAAATKIYEGWIMIPYLISMSLLPAIVKLKSQDPVLYEARLIKLFSLLFWLSVLVAVAMTFVSEYLINITFGAKYSDASNTLIIVSWAAAFAALASVSARYLTAEGMEKKIALRTYLGLAINVVLNLMLIPPYGIEGAAISTLISVAISTLFINFFDKDLGQLSRIASQAILLKKRTR